MNVEEKRSKEWDGNGLVVFGGTASTDLTAQICQYLAVEPGHATVSPFPDGETLVKVDDDVRGKDC